MSLGSTWLASFMCWHAWKHGCKHVNAYGNRLLQWCDDQTDVCTFGLAKSKCNMQSLSFDSRLHSQHRSMQQFSQTGRDSLQEPIIVSRAQPAQQSSATLSAESGFGTCPMYAALEATVAYS